MFKEIIDIFDAKEIANIMLHIMFIVMFLSIFFFTYVSIVEEDIVKKQIAYLVKNVGFAASSLPNSQKQSLLESLNNFKIDTSKQDALIEQQNRTLIIKVLVSISSILVATLVGVWYMSKHYHFSYLELLRDNIIIVIFIGVAEFCFATFVAKNYMSLDLKKIKTHTLEALNYGIQNNVKNSNLFNNLPINEINNNIKNLL